MSNDNLNNENSSTVSQAATPSNTNNETQKENTQEYEQQNTSAGEKAQDWYNQHVTPWAWLKNIIKNTIKSVYDAVTYGVYTGLDAVTSPFKKNKNTINTSNEASYNKENTNQNKPEQYNPLKDKELNKALKENQAKLEVKNGNAYVTLYDFPDKPIIFNLDRINSHEDFVNILDAKMRERGQEVSKARGFQSDHILERIYNLSDSLGKANKNYNDLFYQAKVIDTEGVIFVNGIPSGEGSFKGKPFTFNYKDNKVSFSNSTLNPIESMTVSNYLQDFCSHEIKARENLVKNVEFKDLQKNKGKIKGKFIYKGREYSFSFDENNKLRSSATKLPQDIYDALGRAAYAMNKSDEELAFFTNNPEKTVEHSQSKKSHISDIYPNRGGETGTFKYDDQFIEFSYKEGKFQCNPDIKLSKEDRFKVVHSALSEQYRDASKFVSFSKSQRNSNGSPSAVFLVDGKEVNAALDKNNNLSLYSPAPDGLTTPICITLEEREYITQILKEVPEFSYKNKDAGKTRRQYNFTDDKSLQKALKTSSQYLPLSASKDDIVIGNYKFKTTSSRSQAYSSIENAINTKIKECKSNIYSGFGTSSEIKTLKDTYYSVTGEKHNDPEFSNIQYLNNENINGTIDSKYGKFNFEYIEGDVAIKPIKDVSTLEDVNMVDLQNVVRQACERDISFRDRINSQIRGIDLQNGEFRLSDNNTLYNFSFNGTDFNVNVNGGNFNTIVNLSPEQEEYLKLLCMEQKVFPGYEYSAHNSDRSSERFTIFSPEQSVFINDNKTKTGESIEYQAIPFVSNGQNYKFYYDVQNDNFLVLDSNGNQLNNDELKAVLNNRNYTELKNAGMNASLCSDRTKKSRKINNQKQEDLIR